MPSFQDIYQAAIAQDETAIQNFLMQDPACLNLRQEEEPNLTVAEFLAQQNQRQAVDFLIAQNTDINIIAIALAYARSSQHDAAEQFLLNDEQNAQLADDLARTYARANNDERVGHYINVYRVNLESVILGYAEGGFYRKAEHYFTKITEEAERALVRDLLAWVCARNGNQEYSEYYVNQYAVLPETIINGYVAGGHDELVDELLQKDPQPNHVNQAVWRYAFDGKHDKVQEFLLRYPNLSRLSIAGGYSQAGDDERAALYQVPSVQEEIDQEEGLETDGEIAMAPTSYNALPAFRCSVSSVEEGEAESDGEEERAETTHSEDDRINPFLPSRFSSSSAEEMRAIHSLSSVEEGEAESDGEEERAETTHSEDGELLLRSATGSEGEEEDNQNEEQTSRVANHGAGGVRANNNGEARGSDNANAQSRNNGGWHGIDMHVLSIFVAGVGATAVAAAIVALALQAITLPVCLTIATVGVVATGLGGFGFFKYAPQAPAAENAVTAEDAPRLD